MVASELDLDCLSLAMFSLIVSALLKSSFQCSNNSGLKFGFSTAAFNNSASNSDFVINITSNLGLILTVKE